MKTLLLICFAAITFSYAKEHEKYPVKKENIQTRCKKLLKSFTGKIGIHALHLETNSTFSVNEHDRFPMASTCKIPIAIQCLSLVDKGVIRLTQREKLIATTICPYSPITQQINGTYTLIPVQALLELMLEISDNTATDVLLKLIGGPQAVNTLLKKHTIKNISIDRSVVQLLADYHGFKLPTACTLKCYYELEHKVSQKQRLAAEKRFYNDTRDTSSAYAMVDLLRLLYTNKLLSKTSTDVLLASMKRCKTGFMRIPGKLPEGVVVAHKTGSLGGITNDVGIIELPHHKGHIIIAIFITKSCNTLQFRETLIADISKLLFDYFMHDIDATSFKSPSY